MHLVVLDDDRGVRESLTFMLQVAGVPVWAYASADEFLQRCDLDRVLGLIIDQHMPGVTGLDVAGRLRARQWRFPILLISADPSPAIVARASQLEIENVLTKPFIEADVMAFVRRVAAG